MIKFDVIRTFKICRSLETERFRLLSNNIKFNCSLINSFYDSYIYWKYKLPYHLNLIDELHANENAHSRILVKLLQYEIDFKFPVLHSFIDYFADHKDEFKFIHTINKPKIATQKHRIDAQVIDDEFAIIIENKIHSSKDQE